MQDKIKKAYLKLIEISNNLRNGKSTDKCWVGFPFNIELSVEIRKTYHDQEASHYRYNEVVGYSVCLPELDICGIGKTKIEAINELTRQMERMTQCQ